MAESAPETPLDSTGAISPRSVDWENPRVASILTAAAKCFSRKGFTATTLAEIGRELGLRKSIVHYYFASKAALIHEVQSYAYHRYLDRVRDAIKAVGGDRSHRAEGALESLWEALHSNKANVGLSIEVWSAARRDPELKRRAAALQKESRKLVADGIADVLGGGADQMRGMEATSALILAVLNGLSVAEYLEGDEAKARDAYRTFLYLLRLGIQNLPNQGASAPAE